MRHKKEYTGDKESYLYIHQMNNEIKILLKYYPVPLLLLVISWKILRYIPIFHGNNSLFAYFTILCTIPKIRLHISIPKKTRDKSVCAESV